VTHEAEIENLRREISRLNEEIVEKLAERAEFPAKIGVFKSWHERTIVNRSREEMVYYQNRRPLKERGMDNKAFDRVFREIIRLPTRAQREGLP
jgi:chorismate mutase